MKNVAFVLSLIVGAFALTACEPEVGSKDWCEMIKEKPKGDLSTNEAAEFAKSCVF